MLLLLQDSRVLVLAKGRNAGAEKQSSPRTVGLLAAIYARTKASIAAWRSPMSVPRRGQRPDSMSLASSGDGLWASLLKNRGKLHSVPRAKLALLVRRSTRWRNSGAVRPRAPLPSGPFSPLVGSPVVLCQSEVTAMWSPTGRGDGAVVAPFV